MNAADVRPPGSGDAKSLKPDEENVMQLRSLMHEQSDTGAEVAAVERDRRCVRLEFVPSSDTLRDWCERLSNADTADALPAALNYLLDELDEQS